MSKNEVSLSVRTDAPDTAGTHQGTLESRPTP